MNKQCHDWTEVVYEGTLRFVKLTPEYSVWTDASGHDVCMLFKDTESLLRENYCMCCGVICGYWTYDSLGFIRRDIELDRKRYFRQGDKVRVTHGQHKGEIGEVLGQYTGQLYHVDGEPREVEVRTSDWRFYIDHKHLEKI